MNYALRLITAPVEEPLTLEQARVHLKSSTTTEDGLILSWITAAREQAEQYLSRGLITQTWEMSFDAFDGSEIDIPLPPLQSVTSIKYFDTAAVEQTLSSALYHVDTRSPLGRIVLDDSASWPTTDVRPNAVTIRFVCGYGLAGAVPQLIKTAMQLLVQYHEGRQAEAKILEAAECLLSTFKIQRF